MRTPQPAMLNTVAEFKTGIAGQKDKSGVGVYLQLPDSQVFAFVLTTDQTIELIHRLQADLAKIQAQPPSMTRN